MTRVAWFSTDWQFEDVKGGKPGRKVAYYGGTYHYRMGLPCDELGKNGWDTMMSWAVRPAPDGHIQVLDHMGETWHDDCDVIVFQRWMRADAADMTRRARACGQTIIQDVDDLFWALPKSNIAHEMTEPTKNVDFNRDHYHRMIGASDALIVSTDEIARWLAPLKVPTFICRNGVRLSDWPVLDAGVGMVGWVGGVAWRAHDLQALKPVLPQFLEDWGIPFYHGGHDPERRPWAWEQLGIDTNKTKVYTAPLVALGRYPSLWGPLGLALVPLEDTPFNRAKSWLKGLEAAASGLPFIASDMPEYRRLGFGRLAKNSKPSSWRYHLDQLADPEVRRIEGADNRMRAQEHDMAHRWKQWDEALRAIIPVKVPA